MQSSDIVARAGDICGDDWLHHRSKQRVIDTAASMNNDSDDSHPTNVRFQSAPLASPPPFSSPSASSRFDKDEGPSTSSPAMIEEEEVPQSTVSSTEQLQQMRRLALVNVVRPIPKRISNRYYKEAYQNEIPLQETNRAAMMAQDWHRKWTYQDEVHHTLPDQDFYHQSTNSSGVPESYATNQQQALDEDESQSYCSDCSSNAIRLDPSNQRHQANLLICLEREEGAKNPSLESSSQEQRHTKRHHHELDQLPRNSPPCANPGPTMSLFQDFDEHNNISDDSRKSSIVPSPENSSTKEDSSSYHDPMCSHRAKKLFTNFACDEVSIEEVNDYDAHSNEFYSAKEEEDQFAEDESEDTGDMNSVDDVDENPPCQQIPSVIQRPLPIRPVALRPSEENEFVKDDTNDRVDISDKTYVDDERYDGDDEKPLYQQRAPMIQRPLPIRPVVVRPVPVHASRRGFPEPNPTKGGAPTISDRNIPVDIVLKPAKGGGSTVSERNKNIPGQIFSDAFEGETLISPMSPTCSQYTGSSRKTGSTLSSRTILGSEMIGITVVHPERNGLFVLPERPRDSAWKQHDEFSISTSILNMEKARDEILRTLAISDGDVECKDFLAKVDPLEKYYLGKQVDTRSVSRRYRYPSGSVRSARSGRSGISTVSITNSIEGMWLTLSKPNFFGKLGHNDNGDPMYTLGRMSFDMFSPTNLVCSLQGNFNRVEIVSGEERRAMLDSVPKKLREEVESGKTVLRTYHVVTAFTIEPAMAAYPNAPNQDVVKPIRGIMTTYGYSLPDPETPNRHSIWFTGGRVEPNNEISDILMWKNFFTLHPPSHTFGEKAKLLAVKLLMGATIPEEMDPEDGSMNYVFTRPLGGHGMAYMDVIYMDESLRICRGQRGTIFVFSRVTDL